MYFTTNDSNGTRETVEFNGKLYAACSSIVGEVDGVVMARDSRRSRVRLVAFWCAHEGRVKPGFQARDDERAAVTDYRIIG